jgi:uncharacterized protein (UPF0303 family)
MSVEDDLRIIAEQERGLVLDRIDEDVAFAIATQIRAARKGAEKGIAFGVYLWDRTLAYGGTVGASEHNRLWIERKAKTVRLFLKSSYRLVLERGDKPRVLEPQWGLAPQDYALAGGGFPLTLRGAGVVGAVVVSGLAERVDHEISRAALAHVLGLGDDGFALPPA